jgi:hypothetical protein
MLYFRKRNFTVRLRIFCVPFCLTTNPEISQHTLYPESFENAEVADHGKTKWAFLQMFSDYVEFYCSQRNPFIFTEHQDTNQYFR